MTTNKHFRAATAILCTFTALLAAVHVWPLSARGDTSKGLPADVALIPSDAIGFVRISLADICSEAMVKKLLEGPGKETYRFLQEEIGKKFGLSLADLETLTLVILPPTASDPDIPAMLISSFSKPIQQRKVIDVLIPDPREEVYRGKVFHVNQFGPPLLRGIHFVNDRTMVVGNGDVFKRWVDSVAAPAATHNLSASLAKVAERHHIVGGVRIPEKLADAIKQEKLPLLVQPFKPLLDMQSGVFTASFGSESKANLVLSFADEAKAEKGRGAVEYSLASAKLFGPAMLTKFAPPAEYPGMARLMKSADAALQATSAEQRQTQIVVVARGAVESGDLNAAFADLTAAVREAALRQKSAESLRQLLIAFHTYAGAREDELPPVAIFDKDGTPLLSWRVKILPYIGQDALYKEFKLNEPWDSPNNKKLLAKMPAIYSPVGVETKEPYTTFYHVFTGENCVFDGEEGYKLITLTNQDGTSNTACIVEAGEAVPWTKPVDLVYDGKKPLPKLGGMNKKGFNVVFCDGHVIFIKHGFDEKIMRLIITPNDKRAVNFQKLNP